MPKKNPDLDIAKKQIYSFFSEYKRMPSYQEICNICKLGSKNTAHTLVHKLKAIGALETDKTGKIIPTESESHSIKLLGLVEACFPTPSEESLHEQISLDDWVIQKKEASYMLRVKGDSMKDAGILDGDMIIVERTTTPKTGQIVVAEIDGSYTLKYLRKGSSGYYLEAANSKYKPMYPTEELQIVAIVKAVVRKYA